MAIARNLPLAPSETSTAISLPLLIGSCAEKVVVVAVVGIASLAPVPDPTT